MTTLEDLYYGNISPHERFIKRGTKVDKLVKMICKNEESLTAGLTEQQKDIKIPTGSGGQALNLATISGGKFFALPL